MLAEKREGFRSILETGITYGVRVRVRCQGLDDQFWKQIGRLTLKPLIDALCDPGQCFHPLFTTATSFFFFFKVVGYYGVKRLLEILDGLFLSLGYILNSL